MIGDNLGDCGLCGGRKARGLTSCGLRAQSLQGGGTAASLSLPKPSRYIYSNTTAPSVAAAECTLSI